jgi:glutamyl-tRNA reductase
MSIVVLGVNHRSAPLDVIEKVTISSEALANALQDSRNGGAVNV